MPHTNDYETRLLERAEELARIYSKPFQPPSGWFGMSADERLGYIKDFTPLAAHCLSREADAIKAAYKSGQLNVWAHHQSGATIIVADHYLLTHGYVPQKTENGTERNG